MGNILSSILVSSTIGLEWPTMYLATDVGKSNAQFQEFAMNSSALKRGLLHAGSNEIARFPRNKRTSEIMCLNDLQNSRSTPTFCSAYGTRPLGPTRYSRCSSLRGSISEIHAERELDIPLAAANAAALCRHFSKVRASGVEVHGPGSGDTTAASTPIGVVDEV